MPTEAVMRNRISLARQLHRDLAAARTRMIEWWPGGRLGFSVTAHGHLDTGHTGGPCVLCGGPTVRYGSQGSPWCNRCQEANERTPRHE